MNLRYALPIMRINLIEAVRKTFERLERDDPTFARINAEWDTIFPESGQQNPPPQMTDTSHEQGSSK